MDLLWKDLRYGLRRLAASPLFTAVAIVSLALGIGANSAIFSIVNAVLLRDLPVNDSDRLVNIYSSDSDGFQYATSSYPDYDDLRATTGAFSDVMSFEIFIGQAEWAGASALTIGELVSGNYFEGLGVRAAIGRTFAPEETATPGTHAVVVVGDNYWKRVLGGRPDVVGSTILLQRTPYTIIGVLPPAYKGMFPGLVADMYVPSMMVNHLMPGPTDRLTDRHNRGAFLLARLAPGVTVAQAGAAVAAFSENLAAEYPASNERVRMSVMAANSVAINPAVDKALVPVAGLLLVVVGLVLLIACANLASFLLARAMDRRREIAVRLALGAKRTQLVRQLLIESVFLALLGGAAAILVAGWVVRLIVGFQPPLPIPLRLDLGIDASVLMYTLFVSVGAGIAFGLAPGLQATRPDVSGTLRDEAGSVVGGRRFTLRNVLVAGQVAFSLLLLVGSGLFLRSLGKAQRIDPGFDTGPAAIIWPQLDMSGFDEERGRVAQRELRERLEALPGVTGVAMAGKLPLGAAVQTRSFNFDGVDPPAGRDAHSVDFTTVDGAYFDVLGIPILSGRTFNDTDASAPRRVIVSEALVDRFLQGRDPIGETIWLGTGRDRPATIIGVARDTKVRTLGEAPRPYVYISAEQEYIPSMLFVIHGSSPAPELVATARRTALDLDPKLILLEAKTMQDHLALLLYPPRMAALLLSVMGGLALLLAAVGLYGTVSYAVSRRTREVGVRSALGATRRDVVMLLTGGGMKLIGIGALVGLGLAAAVTWMISGFLYGVGATDVATFVGVPLVLLSVGFLACWIPARRAARIDPMIALRAD